MPLIIYFGTYTYSLWKSTGLKLFPLILQLHFRQTGVVRARAALLDQFLKFRPVGLGLGG